MAAKRTINRRLVDKGITPFGGENLPFFLMIAHIRVHTKSQERDNNIQIVIWSSVSKHLGQQAICKRNGIKISDYLANLHIAFKLVKRIRTTDSFSPFFG